MTLHSSSDLKKSQALQNSFIFSPVLSLKSLNLAINFSPHSVTLKNKNVLFILSKTSLAQFNHCVVSLLVLL